jgi:hypothetical protein
MYEGNVFLAGKRDELLTAFEDAEKDYFARKQKGKLRDGETLQSAKDAVYDDVAPGFFIFRECNAITTVQLDAAWWLCRSLSMTSSTAYALIKVLAQTIDENHDLRTDFELVSTYANFYRVLPGAARTTNDDNSEDNNSRDENDDEELELSHEMRQLFKPFLILLPDAE